MNTFQSSARSWALALGLGVALGMAAACAQKSGEVQLHPETREGMFYLRFAEAQEVARTEGKHLLLDFWRPG